MRVRFVSVAFALVIVALAYRYGVQPYDGPIQLARNEAGIAEVQAETLRSRDVLMPRLQAERHALAQRIGPYVVGSPSAVEASFLSEATALSRRDHLHIESIESGASDVPLQGAEPVPTPTPVAGVPPALPATVPGTVTPGVDVAAKGVRIPLTMHIIGSLPDTIRFLDGLGHLKEPVNVLSSTLAQTDELRTQIEVQIIVLDPAQMREIQA